LVPVLLLKIQEKNTKKFFSRFTRSENARANYFARAKSEFARAKSEFARAKK
jgi:hypothetical protein